MKISEIKNKELRELAELRRSEGKVKMDLLVGAFEWDATPEGFDFWDCVDEGHITSLQTPKQWLDERGTLEVGSTFYNLVLSILEDYSNELNK